jgi:RNA exonuclease 4
LLTLLALFQQSTASITVIGKKRTRGRRRGGRRSGTISGNVSESSEESKRSTQRKNAPKKTKAQQQQQLLSVEEQANYVAMDCEMVGVGFNGKKSTLARVTLVNWDGDVLYDQFIQPSETVTDYRTFVSGITAADLESAHSVCADACRAAVTELLRGKTVIGHALKNDRAALHIQHPWQYTRDTAKYEPFMKQRFNDGILWPRKLKELVWEHLGSEIQPEGKPHSAYVDAVAALELYKCVRSKWEKVMQYKICKTAEIEQQKQGLSRTTVTAAVADIQQKLSALAVTCTA